MMWNLLHKNLGGKQGYKLSKVGHYLISEAGW